MIEKTIPVDEIESTPNRENGGDGDIKILAEDIKHNGLINPVTVKCRISPSKDGMVQDFILIAGRRRVAAARLLGWKEIVCRILTDDEIEHADEIALSENVNRLAMHPLDEAVYFKRLLESGEPVQSIAKRCDRTASGIWQRVQLLELSPDIREMFREGKLDLQSAAMLKSLDEKEQAEFVKTKKNYVGVLSAWSVSSFIRGLHNDEVYKFLGKDCEKCKTRTFFTEKSLFPEAEINHDSCLDHGCYARKWTKLLEGRVKSLKGEHQSHAAASLIVFSYTVNLQRILGKNVTLDGTDYRIAERDWSSFSDTGGAGEEPCVFVSADGAKLKVSPVYRKAVKETTDLKDFSAELKLLDLPKKEDAAVREALKAKKIDHYAFTEKVRERVLSGLIAARAADLASSRGDAGLLLGNAFRHPSAKDKKIFSLFTGKEYAGSTEEALKLGDTAAFALLYALSLSEYDIPTVWSGEKPPAVFGWSGLAPGEIKKLYQEAIRERLPKPKAEKPPAKAAKGKKKS